VIAEGCADNLRLTLAEVVPRLLALLQDSEHYVRECACFALGQFAEHCQPDILHYHESVLPVVFQALDDPKHTVQTTACFVAEMFVENLQKNTLRPFLHNLLLKLTSLLNSPKKVTQELALTAISSVAVAAEDEFLPYSEVSQIFCHYHC
jgi:HEAT-like repeat